LIQIKARSPGRPREISLFLIAAAKPRDGAGPVPVQNPEIISPTA
jgi:hypothetical protein